MNKVENLFFHRVNKKTYQSFKNIDGGARNSTVSSYTLIAIKQDSSNSDYQLEYCTTEYLYLLHDNNNIINQEVLELTATIANFIVVPYSN